MRFEKIKSFGTQRIYSYCISFFLVISVVFAYWNIDKLGFSSYDDEIYVTGNTKVFTGLNKPNIAWAFSSFCASNWHPLTWMSHMADAQIYGLKPAGHHLTSLLFHILNTLLLFFLLKTATGAFWKSALVSVLFGIHPIHVESVAWISERKDVLSTFFMLLTLITYIRFTSKKKISYYFAALIFFALGLMAKPMLVTLPCVMLLMDFWPLNRMKNMAQDGMISREKKKRRVLLHLIVEKLPFFVLAGISSVITFTAQRAGSAVVSFTRLPFGTRLCNAAMSYCGYIEKTIVPTNYAVFYPYPLTQSMIKASICFIILVLLTIVFTLLRRKRPYLIFGWLWYIGILVPVLGIVQVGAQAMADRYMYVPSIGLFILFTWAIFDGANRWTRIKPFLIFFMVIILGILLYQTRKQVGYWTNDLTLADHALSVTLDNYTAFEIKGNYFMAQGNYEAAKENFLKSLSICKVSPYPRLQIGWVLLQQGRYEEAIGYFGEVLDRDSTNVLANSNCATAMSKLKDFDNARSFYFRALKKDPAYVPALYNLGLDYEVLHEYATARQYFSQVLRYKPGHHDAIFHLNKCRVPE